MKNFIVVYEAYEGAMQFFGPFESKESASKWMSNDFVESIEKCVKELGYEPDWIHDVETASIDGYGEWRVAELEHI